jgi:hypothetical protein
MCIFQHQFESSDFHTFSRLHISGTLWLPFSNQLGTTPRSPAAWLPQEALHALVEEQAVLIAGERL